MVAGWQTKSFHGWNMANFTATQVTKLDHCGASAMHSIILFRRVLGKYDTVANSWANRHTDSRQLRRTIRISRPEIASDLIVPPEYDLGWGSAC